MSYYYYMENFIQAYYDKLDMAQSYVPHFVGSPEFLSPLALEELIYRYQYLHESTGQLAKKFHLAQPSLDAYISQHNFEPIFLESEEDQLSFEDYLRKTFKQHKAKLTGLAVYQAIRTWYALLQNEETLLVSLSRRIEEENKEGIPDAKILSQLISSHDKIYTKQQTSMNLFKALEQDSGSGSLSDLIMQALTKIDGDGYELPTPK